MISDEGPVMREVPLSTIPLVALEEYPPSLIESMAICQYLGSDSGIQVISPLNFESSDKVKKVVKTWVNGIAKLNHNYLLIYFHSP
jgi:glutathione S-transferase